MAGNLLEIGVFEGRSGILLALMAAPTQTAVLMDLFDAGASEVPRHGGNGDLEALRRNLSYWAPKANTEIIKGDSVALDFAAISSLRRGLRFAHIDGGHDKATVLNDLSKCATHLVDGGLIVVDDFWHSGYPEVNEACNEYIRSQSRLVPIAVGKNKLLLTPSGAASDYKRWLGSHLRRPVGRQVRFHGQDVYCLDVV